MYIAQMIRAFAAWRRYRMAVQQLSEMDERTLHDLGITRSEIKQVAWNGR